MHPSILFAASLLSTTATNSKHFSIGPWIIVPIIIVGALVAVPIYIVKDRRKRRKLESEWSKTARR